MTPQEFIRKWKPVALTERATAQEHFIDLCRLFDHPTPVEDDPVGDHFTFEKGAPKTGGGEGWADVWKKGYFAWEYKKKKRDLDKALEQLTRYAAALENPPLHVACDTHIFRIETRWTNEVPAKYEFELEELADPVNLARLRAVFHNPDELRSGRTRDKLTKEAADKFQTISDRLQHRNPNREAVAHFVNQLVFCFFADSVRLLPGGLWKKLLQAAERKPNQAQAFLTRLFDDMAKGGDFDLENILEFNGGLFDGRPALALEHGEIGLLFAAANILIRKLIKCSFPFIHRNTEIDNPHVTRPACYVGTVDPRLQNIGVGSPIGVQRRLQTCLHQNFAYRNRRLSTRSGRTFSNMSHVPECGPHCEKYEDTSLRRRHLNTGPLVGLSTMLFQIINYK